MSTQKQTTHTLRIVNIVGALGYTSVALQWLWLLVTLVFPALIISGASDYILPQQSAVEPQKSHIEGISLPPMLEIILIVAAVIFSIGICVYALYYVPKSIGVIGKKVSHGSAASVTHYATTHKKISKKQAQRLTIKVTWTVKAILVLAPVFALLLPVSGAVGLQQSHVAVIGLFCAFWSAIWFVVQLILARVYALPSQKVW